MESRAKSLPKNLSCGQQQRVAIARALVTDPSTVLCDEPAASLDIRSASIAMEELRMLSDSGKSVIVVTHDVRLKPFAGRREKRLLLFAELKIPGEAWLEFRIDNQNKLHQTATFRPLGLRGSIYEYSVLPYHSFIFRGMIRNIAKTPKP